MRKATLTLALSLLAATHATAQNVDNVRLERRVAQGDLTTTVDGIVRASNGPLWIAYSVRANQPGISMCCGDWNRRDTCVLDLDRGGYTTHHDGEGRPAPTSDLLIVLLGVDSQRIQRLRTVTPDCRLDAGGKAMIVLDEVPNPGSVAFLKGLVGRDDSDVSSGALMAIAHHAGEEADAALEGFLAPGHPRKVRKDAVFWIGTSRGDRALPVLRAILKDAESDLRKEAIFALHQNDSRQADTLLIETARQDPSSKTRQEAIFWLSQRASEEAVRAIRSAVDQDPDEDVKEKAVFALSQLPPDRGVPHLIRLAKTHDSRKVREKAIFWLGQSGDSRALDFFEEILSGKGGR